MPDVSRLSQPEQLDDLLLYRLGRLTSTAGTMVIRLCEGRHGITRREWRVLALLGQQDGLLSSQLADRIQLDRARTSKAISSMLGKKLVHRESGASDRRQAQVWLTEAGRAVYRELMPQVQQINRSIVAVLDPAEAQQLDSMLARLQARCSDIAAQADGLPKADRRRGGRHPARSG